VQVFPIEPGKGLRKRTDAIGLASFIVPFPPYGAKEKQSQRAETEWLIGFFCERFAGGSGRLR
jgi:hypothetical protein